MIPIESSVGVGVASPAAISSWVTATIVITGYYADILFELYTPNSTISAGGEIWAHKRVLPWTSPGDTETIPTLKAVFPLRQNEILFKTVHLDYGLYFLNICTGGWQGTTNLTCSVRMHTGVEITAYAEI